MGDLETVEMDLVFGGVEVPAVEAELGLADVGGGADEVDGEVVAEAEEAGEVEELVQVALRRERDHHHRHLWFLVSH